MRSGLNLLTAVTSYMEPIVCSVHTVLDIKQRVYVVAITYFSDSGLKSIHTYTKDLTCKIKNCDVK